MSPSLQGPAIVFARSAFLRVFFRGTRERIILSRPRKNSQYQVRKIEPASAQSRKSVRTSSVSGPSCTAFGFLTPGFACNHPIMHRRRWILIRWTNWWQQRFGGIVGRSKWRLDRSYITFQIIKNMLDPKLKSLYHCRQNKARTRVAAPTTTKRKTLPLPKNLLPMTIVMA